MLNPVRLRHFSQFKTVSPVFVLWPSHAIWSGGGTQPHHVNDVPAGVAILPFSLIGIEKVTVQKLAGELVIETYIVIACHAGLGFTQLVVNAFDKFGFVYPMGLSVLWGYSSNLTGDGAR